MSGVAGAFHGWLVASFDQIASRLDGVRFEHRRGYTLVSYPAFPVPAFNGVWALDGDDAAAAAELEGVLAEIEASGAWPGVTTYDGVAPGLVRAARTLGLREVMDMPAMTVGPDGLRPPEVALEVEEVREPDGLAAALDLAAQGFELPERWLEAFYRAPVAGAPGFRIYLGRADGRPVSTAIAHLHAGTAGIFNVATPAPARRHGYGAAITAHAVLQGFAAGAQVAWLQSSPMGQGVYRSLGFELVGTYRLYSRPLAGS